MTLAPALRDVRRGVLGLDRAALRPGEASRVTLGVAVPLLAGILAGFPLVGAAAAAGGLSVGFVTIFGTYRAKLLATLVASVGMGLSTLLGALVDTRPVAAVVATATLGLLAGLVVCLGAPATVTGIQCVVALLVVSQFDLTLEQASLRGLEVLSGGLLQALLLVLPWPLRRAPAERAALARLYLSLAGYARLDVAAPPDPGALAAAAASLADPQPFARHGDVEGFSDLLAEGDRIRTSLAVLAAARARVPAGPVALALEQVGTSTGAVLRLLAAAVRADTAPHDQGVETALRGAGRGATALRDAGAARYLTVAVDALLGQVRAARRSTELLAEHAASGPSRRQGRSPRRVVSRRADHRPGQPRAGVRLVPARAAARGGTGGGLDGRPAARQPARLLAHPHGAGGAAARLRGDRHARRGPGGGHPGRSRGARPRWRRCCIPAGRCWPCSASSWPGSATCSSRSTTPRTPPASRPTSRSCSPSPGCPRARWRWSAAG